MLLGYLFVLVCVTGVLAWGSILLHGFKAYRGIRQDVHVPRSIQWNKANVVVFYPNCLTPEAQADRRRMGWSLVASVVLVLAAFLLSLGM